MSEIASIMFYLPGNVFDCFCFVLFCFDFPCSHDAQVILSEDSFKEGIK